MAFVVGEMEPSFLPEDTAAFAVAERYNLDYKVLTGITDQVQHTFTPSGPSPDHLAIA